MVVQPAVVPPLEEPPLELVEPPELLLDEEPPVGVGAGPGSQPPLTQ